MTKKMLIIIQKYKYFKGKGKWGRPWKSWRDQVSLDSSCKRYIAVCSR